MRKAAILAVVLAAGLGWFLARPAAALTIDEVIELCKAGYSNEQVLEFVKTLGLDEALDSEALVRLKEEGCNSDLAIQLMREYGEEQEEESPSGGETSSRVYLSAGWGYPYSWDWCGTDWYSPWWSVRFAWYDPWYWDSWYYPHSYYPRYHWAWWPYSHDSWWGDRDWHRGGGDYRYVTAHEKTYRTRPGLLSHTKAYADAGGYRTRVSRTVMEKSFKSRAGYAARVGAIERSGAGRRSKSEYSIKKSAPADRSAVTSSRSVRKGSTATPGGSYRKSEPGTATRKATPKSRGSSGTVKRSTSSGDSTGRAPGRSHSYRSSSGGAHPRSSSGYRHSTTPSTPSGTSGSYSAPPPSSGGSAPSSSGSSGSPRPRRR